MTDADFVRALKERAGANDSLVYAHRVYAETAALARRHGLAAPRTALEIGPGLNLGSLFCFAASGVTALAAADIAPLPAAPPLFYEMLREFLLATEGFSWWRAWADPAAAVSAAVSFPSLEAFPSSAASVEPYICQLKIPSNAYVTAPWNSGEGERKNEK